jgi:chorismate synthase
MARNSIGHIFKVSSFGESHGPAIGVIIDGLPAGLEIDLSRIMAQMHRRKPGQSQYTTSRNEKDEIRIISGLFESKTTGSPICVLIENTDSRPSDYSELKDVYRPSHADYTYDKKYGFRDYRGGGRSSARVTAGWVAAGAIAEQLLAEISTIEIIAWVGQIHSIQLSPSILPISRENVDKSPIRCPDASTSKLMEKAILQAKEEMDSLGGVIHCIIKNCPVGVGEPVFGKLQAELGHAMLNINAVKGVSFGAGFDAVTKKGSELNDAFVITEQGIGTSTNNSGGIQGGISNGEDIYFSVAFKPTATIGKAQQTVTNLGEPIKLQAAGRHDPCVLPRAVPVVESMAAIVICDLILESRISKIQK